MAETMHMTRDGKKIPLSELKDSHLKNIIEHHRRKAKEGVIVRHGGGNTAEDIWYDEDHFRDQEALDALNHNAYLNEVYRRWKALKVAEE